MLNLRSAAVAVSALLASLQAGSAFAETAMLSKATSVHKGPGDEFAILGYVDAGRVVLRQCGPNARQETWCYIDSTLAPGWIHVLVNGRLRGQAGPVVSEQSKGTVKTAAGAIPPPAGRDTGTARGRAAAGGGGSNSDGTGSGTSPTDTGTGRDRAAAEGGGSASPPSGGSLDITTRPHL